MSPALLCLLEVSFSRVFLCLSIFTPCFSCPNSSQDFAFVFLLSYLCSETFLAPYRGCLGLCSRLDSFPTPAIIGSQMDFLLFGDCSVEAPTREELDKISQYLPLLKAFHASLKTRMRSYSLIASLLNNKLTHI